MKSCNFKSLKIIFLLLIGVIGTLFSNAQTYLSFEDATPPTGWTNTGINPLTTDSAHFKLGRMALKWKWNARDTLKVDNPDTLLTVSSISSNTIGFYTWVYNENPKNDSLKFLITDAAKTVNLTFKMYINFKGWRCVYVDLKQDLKYAFNASKPLRYLNIIAPSTGNGNLYFDLFEMQNGALWNKGNDFFVNVDPGPPYNYVSPRKLNPDTSSVNLSDSVYANIIQNKLEAWIIDSSAIAGDTRGYLNSRVKGIQDWVKEATTKSYSPIYRIKFQRQSDNSVIAYDSITGEGMGLFSEQFFYSQRISEYTNSILLQLAINYKVFKVASDLQRCIDILDWMYDQGVADSSVMGSLYLQTVRLTALPQAFFILRNDLPISTYNNTLNTIRWLILFGTTYGKKYASMESKNADDIRGAGLGKLIYALSLKNQKERIVSLDSLQSFFNYSFALAPGGTDIFKFDYSTYHHGGTYTSEYGDDALHQASLIYYFLDNTNFSLSEPTYNLLRNTWLRYDLMSSNYGTPAGTGGRFPVNTGVNGNMLDRAQALAALSLSAKGGLDDSLKGTLNRLVNIDTALLRANSILKSSASIQYTNSLGAVKDLIRALSIPITAKDSMEPADVQYMPYSGLFIHRNKGWLTTIRGFSKYIYDYECLGGDNYLGRYLSYGNMEISSSVNKKLRLVDSCYDWSHIAGTTVKYLPLSVIRTEDSLSSGTYWRFSDQTFLGGVRMNDSIGAFSMFLHNTTKEFDSTFRAKKSSFFFGNVIYNMGSSIKNTDNANQTHTTLYQTLIPINSSPLVYINGVVDTISHNYPSPTNNLSIKDSWGNAYIVYGGNDSLYIKREVRDNLVRNTGVKGFFNRTYDVAYLSHGKTPNNKKYNYAVLLQPTQQEIDTLMNTSKPVFQVLRQDDSAHAVYNTLQGVFGFSFFTPTATLNYSRSILRKVYNPSILMESINADSCSRTIVFTDPDLRRTAATGSAGDTLFGQYKLDSLDIAGKYVVISGDTSDVSLSYLGSNLSRLYINASEGKMYKIQLAAINTAAKSVPFTDGSIAVVRLNSVSSAGTQVYVDEYDTLGNVLQTITLDSVYQPNANTSTEEGYVTLSGDGQYIGLTGYARISNGSGALYGSRFDTLNRAVAFIKYDGAIQRKNIIPSLDISKLFYPKSVYTSNGTDYWLGYGHLSGNYGGIMYGKLSASTKPDTLKSITPWATGRSVRQLNLNPDDSTLYFTQGSNQFFKFSSSTLPKDSIVPPATQPATINMPSKGGIKSFFFVTNGNSKLLYVAYSATNGAGIIKYLKNASNGWDSVGYYDTASRNYLSISGRLTSNGVTLFAVRSAVNSNSNSALVKIIDTGSVSFRASSSVVLDSGTNKIFRGVSVVPRLTLSIPNQTYGASPFNITPPSSSSSGTFTYTSSNPSVATINGSTITIVGAGTAVITAIQSSSSNYLAGVTSVTLTVAKAPLTITANPQTVSYGAAISSVTNAGTYTVNGLVNGDVSSEILNNLSYSTNYTNTTAVGASGIIITPIVSGLTAKNYTFNAASGAITIIKATPTITTLPTASNITFGQTLAASNLSGGVGSVAGSFAFTTPSTAPNAGASSQSVTFTPSDLVRYNTVTFNVNVTVVQATPTITVTPTTSNLIYGQTLAASSLSGGVGSVAGTFAFTTPSTVPIVGTTNQSVTFTPTDVVNYSPVTFNVTVTTVKAVPFTNGGVAVVRLSSVSGGGNQVYVDEYDTLGNVKQIIIMDSIYQPSANSSVEEGFLSLSGDGQYISLTGYARTTSASGGVYGSRFDTLNRAVEFIKYDGSVQRKNIMPSLDINKAFYPKSVYTPNGTDFWIGYGQLSSNYGGIMYGKLTSKSTPDTLKSITPWATGRSVKQLNLNPDDSTLYFTQGSSPFFKFSSSTLPIDSIVPPATQPATITMPSKGGAKSFFFVKRGTSKLLYVAYSATSGGGIIKYLKNASNGWDSIGYYDTASRNYLSITGRLTTNGVTLFAVRSATNSNTNSALVRINDTGSAPFNLATSVRLDSGANKVFRGVSIVPQTNTSPTLSFTVPSKTYGEAPFTLTPPTSNSSGAFTYSSSNPAVATINGSTVTIVGAGTTIITATQASTVFFLSGTTTATLTVGKAVLNITANAQSTIYGTAASAITGAANYTVTGLQNGDASSVISGTVTYTTNYTNTTSVASSGITITPVISGLTANNYTFNAVSTPITITKATPSITTAPTATGISYGQTLASSTLSGGVASVSGTFAFTTTSTVPNVGTASQNVTFTPTDAVNYNTVTLTVSVNVVKANPTITTSPSATGITYGQTLASSTLSGGVASVAGSFAFITPSIAPNAGTSSQSVTFTPTNTTNYNPVLINVNVVVAKANTTISTIPTATNITYGQTLSASTLSGGVANVAGTFAFTNPSTSPNAGNASQSVTFTPTDGANYNTSTTNVNVTVNKATPTITTAPTATSITYGQTLASSTLSGGVGSVAGSFAFTNPSTAPNAGTTSQSVTFTPVDIANYNTVSINVNVTVTQANPSITTAPTATSITYGQTLAASTLSGGIASVGGTFAFAAPSTVPSAGLASQVVIFTPTDAVNYNSFSFNVTVTVIKATPTITTSPSASNISFGQTLASSVLSGGVASVSGTFAFNTPTTAPSVGTANQSVTFTPTDLVNYNTVSFTVSVTVVKATPTITTSPTATGITYGQTLASSTLSGGLASVAGTFAFTTPLTAPNAGTGSQSVTFTPTNTTSYNTVSISVNVVVAKANTTISTAPSAANITYGQTLASSTLSGGVTSVAGTFAFTNPSTAPNAGTASQNVTFTPTDSANYNASTTNVNVTVIKATPTIVITPTASNLMYGQTLAASTLNGGVASVPGTFTFTAPSTAPVVGVSNQNVLFTPTDVANNNTATISVNVTTTSASPFTKGGIAVVRLSSATSAGNQVFVDEYDTLGNVKQSILLDSIYQPSANSSTEEGFLTLSGDGQYVGLTGYVRTSNGSGGLYGTRFDTLNRAVAFVKFDGSIQRKNIIPSLDVAKTFFPKSVYTPNGTDYWLGYGHLSGNYGGIMYGKLTSRLIPDTLKSITPWVTGRSVRQLNLNPDDSTLYYTVGSSPIPKFSSSTLPTDSIVPPATQPANITMPSKAGAKSFFFVKNGNSKLLYVAYSTTSGGGIIKYLKNASNGWDSIGYYDTASRNYLSVTGRLTSNGVTLFAVRSAVNSNSNSALVKINDIGSTPFNLATSVRLDSGANKIFRGVSIVPQTSTLPTMSFSLPAQTYGDAPFTITPPSSNSTGAITYTSSNPSVATINGTTVTIVGAGTTTITATQAATINYVSATISATLTVNTAPLTITATDQSKNYGATISLGNSSFTTSGLLFSDAVSSVTLSSAGAINTASATTYPIVPSAAVGTGLSNYNITYNSGTLTVNKVVLTVTADSKNVSLGAATPILTSTFTGFVNNENASVITGSPALATSYTSTTQQSASPVAITAAIGTLSSLNYSFNFVAGSITISCPTGTWTGLISNDYTNTSNWCSAALPDATTNVFIFGAAPNAPTISGTLGVGNLTVQTGATMTVTGTLKIGGNISNNGTIDLTNGTVELNGTAAQSIPANTFNTNTVKNITINNAAGVSLSGPLTVKGTVSPTLGILNTNGYLILYSDSVSTARIGIGSGNYINGNVTVQRYITAKTARKYSFIGSTVSIPIRNAWQQQMYITGAGTGGTTCGNTLGDGGITDKYNTNGFDVTNSNAASMFTYNAAPVNGSRWVSIPNTKSTNLTPGIGYRVNVRGDRNSTTITCDNQLNSSIPSAPEAVTLGATGAVTMGDVTVNLNDTTYSKCTLLANPYPCQIDFASLFSQNANLNNKMWTYSPFGNGNYTTYSQGTIVNGADGYDNTNGGYLSSGQAFFVEANANGGVTFKENVKTSGVIPNTKYFGTSNVKMIRIGMKSMANSLLDEVLIRFNNKGSINYLPDWDAVSFSAANQSLIALKNNNRLAIATRPDTLTNDTTKLGVSSTKTGSFKLSFSNYAEIDSFTTITLRDKFLGVNQDIRSNNEYVFNVTSDVNSKGNNRFELIFRKGTATTLPLTFTDISAREETGNVYVSWKVAQESNIAYYNVERSLDGRDFTVCASVKANNLTTYRAKDTKPFVNNATIYYRVLAIGLDGSIVYSSKAKLVTKQISLIALYPNPLKGNTVQVKMENMIAGKFVVNFINAIGQKVAEEVIIHTGINGSYPINLKQKLAKGLYNVVVKDLNNIEKVFQLIVED